MLDQVKHEVMLQEKSIPPPLTPPQTKKSHTCFYLKMQNPHQILYNNCIQPLVQNSAVTLKQRITCDNAVLTGLGVGRGRENILKYSCVNLLRGHMRMA